jgi:hypothetical protein
MTISEILYILSASMVGSLFGSLMGLGILYFIYWLRGDV